MRDIIPEYPESRRVQLRAAADSWRLPYWDWAKNPEIPWLADAQKFFIKMWSDKDAVEISNPLYQFKMPNDRNMGSEGVNMITIPDEDIPDRRVELRVRPLQCLQIL